MASSIKTVLCEQLDIDCPVVLAPMGGVSGGRLAAAVSRAGGLGLIGAGYADLTWIHNEFEQVQSGAIGIGFITWYLEQHPEQLGAAFEHEPAAIMLSFGEAAPFVRRIKERGIRLIMQVQTVAMAREAAALGADVIVAQGSDGGGHGAHRGTFALVPAVVDAVSPIPVVAAGGIADGRGVAAALMLGACGVLVGTRFYAAEEALGHFAAKQALTDNSGDDTVRTSIFDIVRDLDWPVPYTGRAWVNDFVQQWHGRENELVETLWTAKPAYQEATASGDVSTAVVWASEAIDLMTSIEPAAALLDRLVEEAGQHMSGAIGR